MSATTVFSTADSTMSLFKVDAGYCMDGSPAAYYWRASLRNSTTWVISLEGGGACYDQKTCTGRSKGHLGSSKNYSATMEPKSGVLSADSGVNPDFADANMVYVPYCSSDTHRGTQNESSRSTWGFYFSGHLNLVAIVNDVKSRHPALFSQMRSMLLTGGSAGGIGTIYNADWLSSVIPSTVTFKAAPLAGWFFAGNYPDQASAGHAWAPPSLYSDFTKGNPTDPTLRSSVVAALWKPIQPDACTTAQRPGEEYHCSTVHVAYHYVNTPMYIMENMYDTNQLEAQGGLPHTDINTEAGKAYIRYFGRGMRNSTALLKPGDGIFLASCLDHGGGLGVGGMTSIGGEFSGKVLGDWFFGRRMNAGLTLRDTCDATHGELPCNPTCGDPGPSQACQSELQSVCPSTTYPTPQKCGQCAKQHASRLRKAGCTVASVTRQCKARK